MIPAASVRQLRSYDTGDVAVVEYGVLGNGTTEYTFSPVPAPESDEGCEAQYGPGFEPEYTVGLVRRFGDDGLCEHYEPLDPGTPPIGRPAKGYREGFLVSHWSEWHHDGEFTQLVRVRLNYVSPNFTWTEFGVTVEPLNEGDPGYWTFLYDEEEGMVHRWGGFQYWEHLDECLGG